MGGLARKSTLINNARADNSNYFIVDAGDLFFKTKKIEPGINVDVAKIGAETILTSYNKIGCDGFNVSEKDFALGLDYLRGLEEKSKFPFISANIKTNSGSYLFNPYKIVDKNGIKLGIIGLSSVFESKDFIVENPLDALNKIIEFVKNQSDLIILLFNANENDISKLQTANLPIDFIIQSKSKKRSNDGGSKNIPVYSCGDRGKYLYEFEFQYNDLNGSFTDIAQYESKIKLMDRKIKNLNKKEQAKINQEERLNNLEKFNNQIKVAQNKIESSTNKIKVNKIALDKTIADDPEILKIVDEAIIKRNIINPQLSMPNPPHGHPGHRH